MFPGADDVRLAAPFAFFGLVVGSFANVVIYRWPRGTSVVFPPSACPSCGAPIRPWHNVPVVSWALLGGRCASCRAPISARYPLIEALMAAGFFAIVLRLGPSMALAGYLAFFFGLVVLAFIDWDVQLLPDVITLPGIAIGLATSLAPGAIVNWRDACLAAAGGYAGFWAIATLYLKTRGIEGLGQGDWKLAAMLGAFLGTERLLLVVLLSSLAGTAYGLTAAILQTREESSSVAPPEAPNPGDQGEIPAHTHESIARFRLPFGTFLAASGAVVLFGGDAILDWYRGFFGAV
jgi:leader peptidase (prepilin peptidase)/N-methyltransferase